MNAMTNLRSAPVTLLLLSSLTWGCADPAPENTSVTRINGISSSSLVIGQTVEVYMQGLEGEEDADYRLLFEGRYFTDDGRSEDVMISQQLIYDGQQSDGQSEVTVLRLSRFGPFANPFTPSNRPGRFIGAMTLYATHHDGSLVQQADTTPVELEVRPSIIIEEFRPLFTECGHPALRALPGLAYRLSVRAVGINAQTFKYTVGRVNDQEGVTTFSHEYNTPTETDVLGEDEAIIFNAIPGEEQFYATGIRIIAEDTDGNIVETALPFSVHRPIEVIHSGKREIAERYPPVPVSSCMPGGIGTRVNYSESRKEFRQQSVSVTLRNEWTLSNGLTRNTEWQEGIREGSSTRQSMGTRSTEDSRTEEAYGLDYGNSERNQMNFETSDGESWNWSQNEDESNTDYASRLDTEYGEGRWSGTVGAKAEGSIPGFTKATGSVSTTTGVRAGSSLGFDAGSSRTDSSGRGFGMGSERSESVGYGSTVTDRRSERIGGTYSLSRSNRADFENETSRDMSRTWDFSESTALSDVSSTGMTEAEQRTWSDSLADESVRSFSALIPNARVGIFYRQTTRWIRRATVRTYDQCGLAHDVGELQFNEFSWAPEMSLGDSCVPPPESSFEGNCLIQPCGG